MSIIELRDVSKSYAVGERTVNAIEDVSLDLERGDLIVILGLNGSDSRDIGNGRWLRYTAEIGMHPMVSDILKARIDEVL